MVTSKTNIFELEKCKLLKMNALFHAYNFWNFLADIFFFFQLLRWIIFHNNIVSDRVDQIVGKILLNIDYCQPAWKRMFWNFVAGDFVNSVKENIAQHWRSSKLKNKNKINIKRPSTSTTDALNHDFIIQYDSISHAVASKRG